MLLISINAIDAPGQYKLLEAHLVLKSLIATVDLHFSPEVLIDEITFRVLPGSLKPAGSTSNQLSSQVRSNGPGSLVAMPISHLIKYLHC